jgi:hypothetical protein
VTAKYPSFSGAVVALDSEGNHGAACHGMIEFPYCVASANHPHVQVFKVKCAQKEDVRKGTTSKSTFLSQEMVQPYK